MKSFSHYLFRALAPAAEVTKLELKLELGRMDAAYGRQDYRTAFAGFKKLAEQGNDIAQYFLGTMYELGQGVPKDEQQAMAWYRKAAEQGFAGAQFNLGVMYDNRRSVPEDDQQAVAWYRKAAEQGFASAQHLMGNMYYKGLGVSGDYQSAYFWWLLASAQGHPDAVKNRDIVERDLLPEQRAAAQAAARNWKPK